MKKSLINFILLATIFVAGCKKEDKRYPFDIDLKRVPYVNVVLDATGSGAIDVINLASFSGKYNITLLYPNDVPPSKVDIVIRKNNVNTNIKMVQAGVTTFPSATLTITAAQIASLFGTPIAIGDNYDLGADIYTQDGTKYEAFPAVSLAYSGTGQANQPGFVPTLRYSAICAYDAEIYKGNFVVVVDKWADTNPGDIIVLTKIDATHFSFDYNPTNHAGTLVGSIPIIVTINTATNTPSIAKQNVGTKWTYDPSPIAPTARTLAGTPNVIAPCDKTVSLNMVWGEAGGEYGPYLLTLKKQ